MASVLDDILDKIKEGVSVIADRTEEYSKIGKLKVEMVSIKRNIEATFTALGGRVYRLIETEKSADWAKDAEVLEYLDKIKKLEAELAEKKEKVEQVRQTKAEARKKRTEEKASDDVVEVEEEKKAK